MQHKDRRNDFEPNKPQRNVHDQMFEGHRSFSVPRICLMTMEQELDGEHYFECSYLEEGEEEDLSHSRASLLSKEKQSVEEDEIFSRQRRKTKERDLQIHESLLLSRAETEKMIFVRSSSQSHRFSYVSFIFFDEMRLRWWDLWATRTSTLPCSIVGCDKRRKSDHFHWTEWSSNLLESLKRWIWLRIHRIDVHSSMQ